MPIAYKHLETLKPLPAEAEGPSPAGISAELSDVAPFEPLHSIARWHYHQKLVPYALTLRSGSAMALYRLGYIRSSTNKQDYDYQVANFERLGYDELFEEKLSGRRRDRPEFLRLAERVILLRGQGHEVMVYVNEWSRWARDTAFALDTLDTLEQAGATVVEATTNQPVTMQTPEGLFGATLKSVEAHAFSLRLSKRIKDNYSYRKQRGRTGSNKPPWGYAYTPEKWIPSEHWAIARQSIEKFLDGSSTTDICRWLWAEHGLRRSINGFNKWLQHPVLRGHQRYPDGTLAYNQHESLISDSEWRAIKYKLDLNRSLRGANRGRVHPIPNGIIHCASCGFGTVPSISGAGDRKRRYFYCKKAALGQCSAPRSGCREDWIEAAIQNAIAEEAERIVDATVIPEESDADPRIAALSQQIEQLRPLASRPAIKAEIDAIQAEIEQIKTATQRATVGAVEREQLIKDLAQATPQDWAELTTEDKRALYAETVFRVRVLGADVASVELL